MIARLTASQDATELNVEWESGEHSTLPAVTLRREARDAGSLRQRIDTGTVAVTPGIQITGLYQVGASGVNVHFSDGHDRAIYPFVYLRELADAETSNDN